MDEKPSLNLVIHSQLLDSVIKLRSEFADHQASLEKIIDLLLEQTSALSAAQQDLLSSQVRSLAASARTQAEMVALPAAWYPGEETEPLADAGVSVNKLVHVALADVRAQDTVSKLKSTPLGTLYLRHLKKYRLVRWTTFQLWRTLYPMYVNHVAIHLSGRKLRRWRALSTLRDYSQATHAQTVSVAAQSDVLTPVPRVVPARDQAYLQSPHKSYVFPEIFVTAVSDAIVYGGTNLVLKDDDVICHDLYDFVHDYTSEELHGRTLIDPALGKIRWLQHDGNAEMLPEAATFVDSCATNYAHWLTEVLPRVATFCADERFKDVPIIVNDGLHKNIMDSLFMVAGRGRPIIALSIGRALRVATLHVTSVAGYVPFERRGNEQTGHSHGLFSATAFSLIRSAFQARSTSMTAKSMPKKIFIRRNSGARKVVNAAALEALLVGFGFAIIEPEKLSFRQQVDLFASADIIVASSGAAVANIIFAPSTARIFVLISKFPNTSYWYWQNMACASGKTVNYVLGEPVGGEQVGIHADFTIDLAAFEQELGKELCPEVTLSADEDVQRDTKLFESATAAKFFHGGARDHEAIRAG